MTEAEIQANILLDLGRGPTRLFRNHVAKGWTGELINSDREYTVLRHARRASFGLCVGSSDIIGFTKTVITPDMVGQTVPIFTAIEAKAAGGKLTKEQMAFIRVIQQAGGLAGVARSVDDARLITTPIR